MKLGTTRDRQDQPVAARQSMQKRRKWRSGKQAHVPNALQSTLSITSKYVSQTSSLSCRRPCRWFIPPVSCRAGPGRLRWLSPTTGRGWLSPVSVTTEDMASGEGLSPKVLSRRRYLSGSATPTVWLQGLRRPHWQRKDCRR